MYRDDESFVRGQKIKLVLCVIFYLIAAVASGKWVP